MDYEVNIEPLEAFDILKKEENSFLVDVRTLPEWSYVGLPDLRSLNKDVLCISWLRYPNMDVNPDFLQQLESAIPDRGAKIFFICKVGGRSLEATNFARRSGYKNCFNVVDGFEGQPDENNHRSVVNGWRAEGLPWFQS